MGMGPLEPATRRYGAWRLCRINPAAPKVHLTSTSKTQTMILSTINRNERKIPVIGRSPAITVGLLIRLKRQQTKQ
jgi:hypothetical protein